MFEREVGPDKKRQLTDLEARYLWTAMALAKEGESERIRHSALQRSTYHSIRARSLSLGWLSERYVPDPTRMGWPRVTFAMATFHGSTNPGPATLWSGEPTAALVWQGTSTVLGVFFYRSEESQEKGLERLKRLNRGLPTYSVLCPVTPESIPIYFDYEGLWAHLIGATGIVSYPIPLTDFPDPPTSLSDRDRRRLQPFVSKSSFDRVLFGMERRTRRLLEKGIVNMRSFLSPQRVPTYLGHSLDYVAVVRGRLKSGTAPELLRALNGECRVFPFLFAVGGGNVLFGAIGQGGEPAKGPVPPRSVREVFNERLDAWETLLEPVPSLRALVDHRYGPLVTP